LQGFFDGVSFVALLIFVLPLAVIAICCYLNQIREGVQEWRQLDQEGKRREYNICAIICIVTWVLIAVMMIIIGQLV
jgi:hypothetical protein